MAVSNPTQLDQVFRDNVTDAATESVSVTAGDLVLVKCSVISNGGELTFSAPSGLGITWVEVGAAGGFVDDWVRAQCFIGTAPSTTSGAITFTGSNHTARILTQVVTGHDTTTPIVPGSVVQASALSLTMAAPDADNLNMAFWGQFHHRETTPNTGWTEAYDSGTGETWGLHDFYSATTADPAPTWNDSSLDFLAGFGFKIAAAAAGGDEVDGAASAAAATGAGQVNVAVSTAGAGSSAAATGAGLADTAVGTLGAGVSAPATGAGQVNVAVSTDGAGTSGAATGAGLVDVAVAVAGAGSSGAAIGAGLADVATGVLGAGITPAATGAGLVDTAIGTLGAGSAGAATGDGLITEGEPLEDDADVNGAGSTAPATGAGQVNVAVSTAGAGSSAAATGSGLVGVAQSVAGASTVAAATGSGLVAVTIGVLGEGIAPAATGEGAVSAATVSTLGAGLARSATGAGLVTAAVSVVGAGSAAAATGSGLAIDTTLPPTDLVGAGSAGAATGAGVCDTGRGPVSNVPHAARRYYLGKRYAADMGGSLGQSDLWYTKQVNEPSAPLPTTFPYRSQLIATGYYLGIADLAGVTDAELATFGFGPDAFAAINAALPVELRGSTIFG